MRILISRGPLLPGGRSAMWEADTIIYRNLSVYHLVSPGGESDPWVAFFVFGRGEIGDFPSLISSYLAYLPALALVFLRLCLSFYLGV